MLSTPSPYHRVAAQLRDMGYSVIPIAAGQKWPGRYTNGAWSPLPGWSKFCDAPAPEFQHEQWERWPEAGVGVAHGAVVACDVDCDRKDVAEAAMAALSPSPVRRRGRKGFAAYYRAAEGLEALGARVRWYGRGDDGKPKEPPLVEMLLRGSQSVLPPSRHPDTGQPYAYITEDTLEDTPPDALPMIGMAEIERLDGALAGLGLTREHPSRAADHVAMAHDPNGHDLEKPWGRSINDRALEPAAIDAWFPELGLPKTRRRGPGCWEAVAIWRPSGSGRPLSERNPNLKPSPQGIQDFGDSRRYTPLDLVAHARDCSIAAAADWLAQFIRPEAQAEIALPPPPPREEAPEQPRAHRVEAWAAPPVLGAQKRPDLPPSPERPSREAFDAMLDGDAPFPVSTDSLRGLLRETTAWIEAAAVVWSEAGALAAALPMLGALMGKGWRSPTNLRTNIYTVALGASGGGKTALVAPVKEAMAAAGALDMLGADRFASGPGLIKMLSGRAPKLSCIDEFGHLLQQIGRPGAGIHAAQILTELTRLYSAANTVYTGTAYSMQTVEPIDCPHLCLFAQSTPDQFWRGFGSAALEDGSAARFLVMPLGDAAGKEPDPRFLDELADQLRTMVAARPDRAPGAVSPPATLAPMTAEAEAAYLDLRATAAAFAATARVETIRGGEAILMRVAENAAKVALVSAVGRNPARPEIDHDDMRLGHAVAWWSASLMIRNIASYVADNQTERDVNDVERFIREAGEAGRGTEQIARALRRIPRRQLKEILEAFEADGVVDVEIIGNPSGGPRRRVYRARSS